MAQEPTLQDIYLISFVAYASDQSPFEHVWNDAKNVINNRQRDVFEPAVAPFEAQVRSTVLTTKSDLVATSLESWNHIRGEREYCRQLNSSQMNSTFRRYKENVSKS